MEIVELRPRLHLIKPSFGQVHAWQDGSQLTMVDTGIPGSEGDLSAAFAELGYQRGDLRRVIITHGHEDHAGAAAAVRAWGDVEVGVVFFIHGYVPALGVARVLGALVSRVDPGALVVRKGVVYLGDRGRLRNLIVDDRVEEHKQSVDRLGLVL